MRRVLAWVLCLCACGEPPPVDELAPGHPSAAREIPEHTLYGCATPIAGACGLLGDQPAELRLWVDQARTSVVEVRADNAVIAWDSRVADGGQLVLFTVPAGAGSVSVRGIDPVWSDDIDLELRHIPLPLVIANAERLAASDDLEGARALLGEAASSDDPLERMLVLNNLKTHDYLANDIPATLRHAEQVVALAEQLGYARFYAGAAFVLFYHHYLAGELELAEHWAGETARAVARFPELTVLSRYQNGLLASAIGDLDRAQHEFSESVRLAERAGDVDWMIVALPNLGVTLAELGRGEQARAVAHDAEAYADDESIDCRERLRIHDAVAWTSIRLAQAKQPHDPPHEVLARMQAAAAPDGECPNAALFDNARITLALYHLIDDEPELARELVDDLVEVHDELSTPWVDELVAQVGLATGRWAQVPETLPEQRGDVTLAWLAALRHAETLERFELDDAAVAAYLELEQRLDRAVRRVGVDAGQERFLASRSISAQRLVEALLRLGHHDLALCRARLAISRALEASDRSARTSALSPDQRAAWSGEVHAYQHTRTEIEAEAQADWSLAADELARVRRRRAQRLDEADARIDAVLRMPAAREGCAQLTAPTDARPVVVAFEGTQEVIAFVAASSRLQVVRVPTDAPASAWARLLAAPLGELAAAQRVTVITDGVATGIPFHALIQAGATLLAEVPIAYGLDLARRPASTEPSSSRALVVADPTGDLAAAAQEADEVERRLAADGWTASALRGPMATRAAVITGLADVALFHYAGHGSRGAEPWDAALRLADDTELRSGDILTLPRVPARVVLAGCHTGRRDALSLAGGMNLGRAFVLAGAESVLVADAEVDDRATRRLSEALYADPSIDLPRALRRAQSQLRAEGVPDWATFRVLVP